jgi:hypothetical protein
MRTFLLVEDNEDDIILMRRSFIKHKVLNPLHAVKSGSEAIAYLMGEGRHSNRAEFAIPKTILLDLKMQGQPAERFIPLARTHKAAVRRCCHRRRVVNVHYRSQGSCRPRPFSRGCESAQHAPANFLCGSAGRFNVCWRRILEIRAESLRASMGLVK